VPTKVVPRWGSSSTKTMCRHYCMSTKAMCKSDSVPTKAVCIKCHSIPVSSAKNDVGRGWGRQLHDACSRRDKRVCGAEDQDSMLQLIKGARPVIWPHHAIAWRHLRLSCGSPKQNLGLTHIYSYSSLRFFHNYPRIKPYISTN
jgi:hypothetical protein